MKTPAIELIDVTKVYRRFSGKQYATLKSALLQRSILNELNPKETFQALQHVSFSVPKGSTFAVVGRNGSGKSTALKLVAGITKPTSGTVLVDGRISALIELGAGFHPEISGRENVFINGIMLGLTKKEITQRFDEIVEFAELKDFIDAPVKTYSSGMYMRLGFAVAIHVDPDVLLVDEVLAVGDEGFTHKCLDKFSEFKRRGKTILLVTHSLGLVERFCDDAVWLDHGEKKAQGDPKRVIGQYLLDVESAEEGYLAQEDAKAKEEVAAAEQVAATSSATTAEDTADSEPKNMFQANEGRWGSGGVAITGVTLKDKSGAAGHVFHSGEPMAIELALKADKPCHDFVFGVAMFNTDGTCVYGTNTDIEEFEAESLTGESTVTFDIETLELVEGTYKLDVAVHRKDGAPYDYHRLLYTFRVKSRTKDAGIYRPRHQWKFSDSAKLSRKSE
jgi:ABC-type polysaccharide/polyol phosphate transport system ATPase subunit